MSLVLTSSGEKLEITAGVVIPFTVHYADYVGATPLFTPGVAGGDTINGTKDLLTAPASGQRVVRTISVHNDSGGADTVTVQIDDGGTNYTVIPATLANGYTLYYDEDGWKVLDGSGALLTVLPTHAILGPHHSDAATDAVTRGSIIVGNATPAWDELVYPGTARHLQTDATDAIWAQNITMADDTWIGVGAALERIVFDTAGDISMMGARIGVNTLTPESIFEVKPGSSADYVKLSAAAYGWRMGQLQSGMLWVGMGVKKNAANNNYIAETGENAAVNHRVIEISYTGIVKFWYQAHQVDDTVLAMTLQFELSTAGAVKIPNLAGVGARNVVAAADGTLSAP